MMSADKTDSVKLNDLGINTYDKEVNGESGWVNNGRKGRGIKEKTEDNIKEKTEDNIKKKIQGKNIIGNDPENSDKLTIVTYNLQMVGDILSWWDNWWNREKHLVAYLNKIDKMKNPDVIVFQEVFTRSAHKIILSLKTNEPKFPYQTPILGAGESIKKKKKNTNNKKTKGNDLKNNFKIGDDNSKDKENESDEDKWDSISGSFSSFAIQNGGVIIISKYPIVQRHAYVYQHSSFPDSLSNKGAVLAQINKNGRLYNVVGTHMQSGDLNTMIRLKQAHELRQWIRVLMEKKPQHKKKENEELKAQNETDDEDDDDDDDDTIDQEIMCCCCPPSPAPSTFSTPSTNSNSSLSSSPYVKCSRAVLCPTDPLIYCGDLNFRFKEDCVVFKKLLCKKILCCFDNIADETMYTYDSVLNDVTKNAEAKPKGKVTRIIYDYLLLSNINGGKFSSAQDVITEGVDGEIDYNFYFLLWFKCGQTKVHHVSDHFPVVATFQHTVNNDFCAKNLYNKEAEIE